MSMRGKSLHVLTPMYGGTGAGNYFESLLRLVLECIKFGIPMTWSFVYNESLIPRARNRLVDEFLKGTDFTHSILIDADIGFDAHDVLAMMELDLDIVGAGCVKKSIRWDRIQNILRQHPDQSFSQDELLNMSGDFVVSYFPNIGGIPTEGKKPGTDLMEPLEVPRLGTGMLMVKREVYVAMKEKYPDRWYEARNDFQARPGQIQDFFRTGINYDNHDYESEDYWFCIDARACGKKVWLCPWIKSSHMGTFKFVGDPAIVAQMIGLDRLLS